MQLFQKQDVGDCLATDWVDEFGSSMLDDTWRDQQITCGRMPGFQGFQVSLFLQVTFHKAETFDSN